MKIDVLRFTAPWCNSCYKMAPIFKSVSDEFDNNKFNFQTIDVESDDGVELSVKYKVRNVPTILVVRNGNVIERIVGTKRKDQLKNILNKWK